MVINLKKEIWEGWTVENFIDEVEYLISIIMSNQSITKKFENKGQLKTWLKDNQPYYKKDIPEVIEYFADKYKLK